MPTVDLLIVTPEVASIIHRRPRSDEGLPTHQLDPIDNVSFAKLISIITGEQYSKVIKELKNLTPEQPGIEPWDIDNLFAAVLLIPKKYVAVLATLKDDQLKPFAKKWSKIEEFDWLSWETEEYLDQLKDLRDFAQQCLESRKDLVLWLST